MRPQPRADAHSPARKDAFLENDRRSPYNRRMDSHPPSDDEVQRRMQELGDKALAELRRRGMSEKEIQKLMTRKKPRLPPRG
jgi:hypothetical protein